MEDEGFGEMLDRVRGPFMVEQCLGSGDNVVPECPARTYPALLISVKPMTRGLTFTSRQYPKVPNVDRTPCPVISKKETRLMMGAERVAMSKSTNAEKRRKEPQWTGPSAMVG